MNVPEQEPRFQPSTKSATSPERVLTIMRKEFREIFRDKRTVISVIVSPLFVTPLLFALLGLMINNQVNKAKNETMHVAVIGANPSTPILKALSAVPNIIIETDVTEKTARGRLRNNTISAIAALPPTLDQSIHDGQTANIDIRVDGGNQLSIACGSRLEAFFAEYGSKLVSQRLLAHNLPPSYATPFTVSQEAIQTGGEGALIGISMFLPYMLVISIFSGAIYAAFDQVAGEKERGTLETLLVSPASRRDIVLGKFGAVVGVCLVSSLLTIAGLGVCFMSGVKAFSWLAKGGLHIGAPALLVILLVLLPLSVLFAGILLAVSTFSRNQKEAQTYLAPLFVVILMPAMASMFLGTDAPKYIAMVPILNTTIIIKQALSGSYDAVFIVGAFAASAVYAAIALAVATRLFQRESVLIKA